MHVSVVIAAVTLLAASPTMAKHGQGEGNDGSESSTAGTPTQTSSSPTGSPTTSPFHFLPPANATTCQNTLLQWQSSNLDIPMTITVTNERAASSSIPNDAALVSLTLATNVSASASQFMWASVDVPPGLYVAIAFDTSHAAGILAQSSPFFVQSGQNSSCLDTASNQTSQTKGPSPTPTTGSDANANSGYANPSQPKKLSPAVLGGVVAGAVVGVILLILVFTFPHYWKEAFLRRQRSRRPGGPYYLF